MKVRVETEVQNSMEEAYKLFDLNLFEKLAPPLSGLNVLRFDGCDKGHEVHLTLTPLKIKWVSLITENFQGSDEIYFVDEGRILPFPLTNWSHKHIIQKVNETTCKIIDEINFEAGLFGLPMQGIILAQMKMRSPIYKKCLSKLSSTP